MNTARCRRCGACCRKGAPVLHLEDMPLLAEAVIPFAFLVTLRAGELARDDVQGALGPLAEETIKIAGRDILGVHPDWTCPFFHAPQTCGIHSRRPAQCRAFFCKKPSALIAMYTQRRIARTDIFHLFPAPWPELVAAHESECAPARLIPLVLAALPDGEAEQSLLEALRFDAAFRELAVTRAAVPEDALFLLFGRPLSILFADFGLSVAREQDGLRLVRSGLCMYPAANERTV